MGSGGGQLSNLLKMSLKLRAMGFKPSKANLAEIAQAMNYRPNQIPLDEMHSLLRRLFPSQP